VGVLSRIGIALDSDLIKRFDRSIARRGYTNRSEAFRDLIRDRLVTEQTAAPDAIVVGTVTLIYNHHASGITEKLTEIQHEHHELVVSTSHAGPRLLPGGTDRAWKVGEGGEVCGSADRPQGRAARAIGDDRSRVRAGATLRVEA
jgi:Arc/MetJ-type ribon-helix-helix transcriptional regulator